CGDVDEMGLSLSPRSIRPDLHMSRVIRRRLTNRACDPVAVLAPAQRKVRGAGAFEPLRKKLREVLPARTFDRAQELLPGDLPMRMPAGDLVKGLPEAVHANLAAEHRKDEPALVVGDVSRRILVRTFRGTI